MYARMLAGFVLALMTSHTALGQSIDRSFKVTTKDCAGVQWSEAALKAYPHIDAACQGVEERDGKTYVRFKGEVVRNIDAGKQLEVKFSNGESMVLTPPAAMSVYMNGRKTPARDLRRGDELTFHVPEDRLVAQFVENDAPAPQYIIVPIIYRPADTNQSTDERLASTLPATAGSLPYAAVFGAVLLGLALAAMIRRLSTR